jgi:hypothetical protein
MPEALAYNLRVNASVKGQCRVAMPEIVKAHPSGTHDLHALRKRVRKARGVNRRSVLVREDERADTVQIIDSSLLLDCMMLAKNGHRCVVQRDHPTASVALRLTNCWLVAGLYNRLHNAQFSAFEIQVAPAQSQYFAASHAGAGREMIGGIQRIASSS